MDYKKIHDQIIERAKNRTVEGYIEKHHIIPKCMGGSDDIGNLVELTAREHFIIHRLLCEIYPNNEKLQYALWCMCNGYNGDYNVSNRTYSVIKKRISLSMKGNNNVAKKKNIQKRISKNTKKWWDNLSDDDKKRRSENLRKSLTGRTLSNHHKKVLSNVLMGHSVSEETRKKIGNANKGKRNGMAKSVRCLQNDCCNNKIYNTVTECARFHNVCNNTITQHIKGRTQVKKYSEA